MARANFYSEAAVRGLLAALRQQADHVEEMGCTCTSDQRMHSEAGHGRECMGVSYARPAYRLIDQWNRRLAKGGR